MQPQNTDPTNTNDDTASSQPPAQPEPTAADPQPQVFSPNQTGSPEALQPIQSGATTPSQTPPVPSTNTVFAPSGPQPQAFSQKSKNKPLLFGLVGLAVLLIGVAGFVFGYYIPNQPENIWSKGLSNTGEEFEAFIDKLEDPETFDQLAKNKITVTGESTTDSMDISGDITSFYDAKDSNSTLNLKASSDDMDQNIEIKALVKTQLVEDSIWPNVYFNVSGFKSLGLDVFMPGISEYDGKWIAMEQDFYDEYLSDESSAEESSNITQQDAVSILRDMNTVSKEYVFTDNPEKAVIILEEFIATEESEGIQANHYKASIHEEHAVAYCKALVDKLYANESFLKVGQIKEEEKQEEIDTEKKSCEPAESEDDEPEEKQLFDIWMDKKHKLFHKVRIYEDLEKKAEEWRTKKTECEQDYTEFNSSSSSFCDFYEDNIETGEKYTEVGQVYKNANEIQFFAASKIDTKRGDYEQKNTVRADINIQLKGLLVNGTIVYNDESQHSKGNATLTIATEPYDGEIDADKPDEAVSLKQVIQKLESQSRSGRLGASTEDNTTSDNKTWLQELESLLTPEKATTTQ